MAVLFSIVLLVAQDQAKIRELIGRLASGSDASRARTRLELAAVPGAREAIEARLKNETDIPLRDQLRLTLAEIDREQDRLKLQKQLAEATAQSYRALAERVYSGDPKEVLALLNEALPGYFSDATRAEFRIVVRALLARDDTGGEWDEIRSRCLVLLRRGPAEEESIKLAAAQLASRSVDLRIEALRTLQTFEAASAVPDVALQLTDSSDALRLEALITLRILRAGASSEAIASLLADPQPKIRAEAALTLGLLGATKYARAIADLLVDRIPEVKIAALSALGRLKNNAGAGKIAALLDDPSHDVQLQAIRTLTDLEAREFIDRISDLLKHEKLRETCLEALSRLGSAATAPTISAYLTDPDARVRIAALGALARLGAKDHLPKIQERFGDTDPWVRREAVIVLARFRATDRTPALAAMLKDTDPLVLIAVIRSLAELGARECAPEIFKFTRADLVLERLQDPAVNATWNDLIRASAVEAVGRLRSAEFADGIADLSKELSVLVRKSVARALVRMSGSKKRDVLIELLGDKERAVVFETILAVSELSAPRLADKMETQTFELDSLRDSAPRLMAAAQKALSLPIETDGILLEKLEVTVSSPASLLSILEAVAAERRFDLGVLVSDKRGTVQLTTQEQAVRELVDWLRSLK